MLVTPDGWCPKDRLIAQHVLYLPRRNDGNKLNSPFAIPHSPSSRQHDLDRTGCGIDRGGGVGDELAVRP